MSFDVYIGDHSRNITANLGSFFAWALHGAVIDEPQARCDSRDAILGELPRDGLIALRDMQAHEALPLLKAAVERVRTADKAWLERFDAENGWGKWQGGLEYLEWLVAACEAVEEQACPRCGLKSSPRIRVSL